MKKKLFVILLLMGLLVVPLKSVKATAVDLSWPETYTHGDYTYTIEGVVINVYGIETDSTTTEENDEETVEVFRKYISGSPDRVITLSPIKYAITPTYSEGKFTDKDATFIDLNLNITKADLEELLSEELAATTENKAYISDIVVQYKVENYPDRFNYVYNRSLMREWFDMLVNSDENNPASKNLTAQDMTKTINQVFSGAVTRFNSETDEAELQYDTEISDESVSSSFAYNGLMFMEKEYGSEDNAGYTLVFHNVDNVDALMEGAENIGVLLDMDLSNIDLDTVVSGDWIEEKPNDSVTNVAVPNTAKNFPMYLYVFSVIVFLSGFAIITHTVYKEQKAHVKED